MIYEDVRVRMHKSHYPGRAIIIFRYLFRTTQIRVIKYSRSVMFHALCTHVYARTVTTNLDSSFFVPPGPHISKYLDPPVRIFQKYMGTL